MAGGYRTRVIGGEVHDYPTGTCCYCYHDAATHPRRPAAFHCANCRRHIGRKRSVYVMDDGGTIYCGSCRLAVDDDDLPRIHGTQSAIRQLLNEPERLTLEFERLRKERRLAKGTR